MPNDKLIKVGRLNSKIDKLVGKTISNIDIFRSKGLLTHLLKRKHYTAAKYLDYLPEVLQTPDYVGYIGGVVELVKLFKEDIFVSVKLDSSRDLYYIATMFDVKKSKIETNCSQEDGRNLTKSSFLVILFV